jgi:hypothetical protein
MYPSYLHYNNFGYHFKFSLDQFENVQHQEENLELLRKYMYHTNRRRWSRIAPRQDKSPTETTQHVPPLK